MLLVVRSIPSLVKPNGAKRNVPVLGDTAAGTLPSLVAIGTTGGTAGFADEVAGGLFDLCKGRT